MNVEALSFEISFFLSWFSSELVSGCFDGFSDVKMSTLWNFSTWIKTEFFFQWSQNSFVSVRSISGKWIGDILPLEIAWFLNLCLKSLNSIESSLGSHNIHGNSIKMVMFWIIISSISVIVILAIPGNIVHWIFQFSNHFISSSIASFFTGFITNSFFFFSEDFFNFINFSVDFIECLGVSIQRSLKEISSWEIMMMMMVLNGLNRS